MANFTKPQILNFLENKAQEEGRGVTVPADASSKYIAIRITKILVEKDIITAADINAAFTEFP